MVVLVMVYVPLTQSLTEQLKEGWFTLTRAFRLYGHTWWGSQQRESMMVDWETESIVAPEPITSKPTDGTPLLLDPSHLLKVPQTFNTLPCFRNKQPKHKSQTFPIQATNSRGPKTLKDYIVITIS